MRDNKFDISVIINAHREGRLMQASVRSAVDAMELAAQSGLTTELIAVLDSADPETKDYCEEYLPKSARVIEVSARDLGLARNAGIKASDAEMVAFLDADDLWGRSWLSLAHSFLRTHSSVTPGGMPAELILHPSVVFYFEGRMEVWKLIDQEDPAFSKSMLLEYNPWTALSFGKRATYEKVPFRPTYLENGFGFEDWLFNCDSIAAGVVHKLVPNTFHCLREKTWKSSLLKETNNRRRVIGTSDLFALSWQR